MGEEYESLCVHQRPLGDKAAGIEGGFSFSCGIVSKSSREYVCDKKTQDEVDGCTHRSNWLDNLAAEDTRGEGNDAVRGLVGVGGMSDGGTRIVL